MKIVSTIQKAVEIDVDPPFFRKLLSEHSRFISYAALVDENTFIQMSRLGNEYLQVRSQLATDCKQDIITTFSTWQTIEESEFMEAYNSMLEGLSLIPKLIEANDLKDINI
jgi:hypothetical protein